MAARPSGPTTSSSLRRAAALLALGALTGCAGLLPSAGPKDGWRAEMELGDTAFHQGLQLEAAAHYDLAAQAARRRLVPGTRLAQSLTSEAAVDRMEGRYDRAAALYEEAAKILDGLPGAAYPGPAAAFYNLAQVESLEGRAPQAGAAYRRFLELSQKAPGSGDGNLAVWLTAAGQFFHAQGSYDEALACYRRALSLGEKTPRPDGAAIAALRDDINSVLKAQGKEAAQP